MATDLNKVKDRIRKLLAIAADDAVADGEITAAMKLAEEAMRKYHLTAADFEAEEQARGKSPDRPVEMKRDHVRGKFVRLTSWECTLAGAVVKLVGSVGYYRQNVQVTEGLFGSPAWRKVITFYGTAEDVELAQELFSEWAHVIAAIAQGRFGGAARGDGLLYADGFAMALWEKAKAAAEERKQLITASTTAIVHCGSGSLADVLRSQRARADAWLAQQGVRLSSTSRSTVSRAGNWNAYAMGRADGARAGFSATRRAKLA